MPEHKRFSLPETESSSFSRREGEVFKQIEKWQ